MTNCSSKRSLRLFDVLGPRNCEKNCPSWEKDIPKSMNTLVSFDSTRNLFPPMSFTPPWNVMSVNVFLKNTYDKSNMLILWKVLFLNWLYSKFTNAFQITCITLSFILMMFWLFKIHCNACKRLKGCVQVMKWKRVLNFWECFVRLFCFSVTDSQLPLLLRMWHLKIVIRTCLSLWGKIRVKICQYLQ